MHCHARLLKGGGVTTKYIFVTGGVVSSIGKGICAAAIGRILKSRGLTVAVQKLDPYLNVDPGTMSPYQHGEVFVTRDGCETDLDLGHYERFIDIELTRNSNITAGQVYTQLLGEERRGDHLGGTIQTVPHVTNVIKEFMLRAQRGGRRAPRPIPAPHTLSFRAKPRNLSGSAPPTQTFPREMFRLRLRLRST